MITKKPWHKKSYIGSKEGSALTQSWFKLLNTRLLNQKTVYLTSKALHLILCKISRFIN